MITVYVFSNMVRSKLQAKAKAKAKAKAVVEKNPLVTFYYPMSKEPWHSSRRVVRLISATPTHITGLEVVEPPKGKTKYQFKKFCQPKVQSFKVLQFNPASMS